VNKTRKSVKFAAIAAASALVFAACGGDDDDDGASETEAPAETDAPAETEAQVGPTSGPTSRSHRTCTSMIQRTT